MRGSPKAPRVVGGAGAQAGYVDVEQSVVTVCFLVMMILASKELWPPPKSVGAGDVVAAMCSYARFDG